jgi:hypothetical protein
MVKCFNDSLEFSNTDIFEGLQQQCNNFDTLEVPPAPVALLFKICCSSCAPIR